MMQLKINQLDKQVNEKNVDLLIQQLKKKIINYIN